MVSFSLQYAGKTRGGSNLIVTLYVTCVHKCADRVTDETICCTFNTFSYIHVVFTKSTFVRFGRMLLVLVTAIKWRFGNVRK